MSFSFRPAASTMKALTALCLIAAAASAAHAQTGTYTWQVSIDNGSTWTSFATAPALSPVKVRLLASWSGVTGSSIG